MKNNATMEDHWSNNPRFKEALADHTEQPLEMVAEQPALECENCKALEEKLYEQAMQPAQEPVAYMGTDIDGSPNKFRLNPFGGCVPLYEKPQSVKVWDAEGYDALCQELEGWKARAMKAEAKLREKNA